jgi:hypothetical protein
MKLDEPSVFSCGPARRVPLSKLACGAAALFLGQGLFGCDGDGDGNGTSQAQEPCTEAQLDETRCASDVLQRCDGSYFVDQEDCGASNGTCQEVFDTVARCESGIEPGGLFDECEGSGQGTCESADLTCGVVTLLSGSNICLDDCTDEPSTCETIQVEDMAWEGYCQPQEVDGIEIASSSFCYPTSERNGVCLYNDEGCSEINNACRTVVYGLNPECKVPCPGNEVGTTPAVCDGQQCLAAPYVEIEQQETGGDKECTTPGTADNCSTTDGYECTEVVTSSSIQENLCARRAGLCGTVAPAAPPFASTTEVFDWISVDGTMCELLGADQYCGPDDAAGALNECAATAFAMPYETPISCSGVGDEIGCFGYGECITFDGLTYECAVGVNLCQRFCTGPDGEDLTAGGTVNPCDTGTCQIPAEPVALPVLQRDDNGDEVLCDEDSSVCTGDFTCDTETFGVAVCIQVRKVCGD